VSDPDPERRPRFLRMMGLVAASVAVTILVFFAIGYLLGRILL
jgi:preprotein translocase subunit SecE